jgi:hypothetical protein
MPTSRWNNASPACRAASVFGGLAILTTILLLFASKPWAQNIAPEKHLHIADYVRIFSWWAGALNCLLLAVLAATARWWMHPSGGGLFRFSRPAFPRWFWPLTIAAMLLCTWFGTHRLSQSFWDDEVYAMRRAIYGQWRTPDDNSVEFRPVKWRETLWFFEKPQHVLHSVLTRGVLNAWQGTAHPTGLKFREDVVRFPSFLFGILSVGSLALLLWRLNFAEAGVIAAFLLALHPWHIRYASEMRAYSLMLFLLPLCYLTLIEALDTGRWRWWIAYGITLFALMYSNALNIYPAIGVGLCGLAALLMNWRDSEAPSQMARFAVATLLAGMAFFQLMLPCVPQFLDYLRGSAVHTPMELAWLSNFFSLLFAGLPWSTTGQPVSKYIELYPWVVMHPALFFGMAGLSIFFISLGLRRLFVSGHLQAIIVLSLLLPAPAAYVIARIRGQHLFEWYLLFLLPAAAGAAALGLDAWRQTLARNKAGAVAGIILIAGILGGYAAFTTPQRTWLISRSLEQIRESVAITRPSLDPYSKQNQAILTASFIGPPDPYDPHIVRFTSVDKLAGLMARADAENKPLFVNFGFLQTAQIRHQPLLKILGDRTLFEKVAELQGFEPINDRYVYRYLPGSLAGRNLLREYKPSPETKMIENRYDTDP